MLFGVASAPAIFQRTIESVVLGVPHIVVQADDILVSGLDDMKQLILKTIGNRKGDCA